MRNVYYVETSVMAMNHQTQSDFIRVDDRPVIQSNKLTNSGLRGGTVVEHKALQMEIF